MPKEIVAKCPVCSNADAKKVFTPDVSARVDSYFTQNRKLLSESKVNFSPETYYYCDDCGFVFRPNIYDKSTLGPVFEEENEDYTFQAFETKRQDRSLPIYGQRYKWLLRHMQLGRLLDIGCGQGLMVHAFSKMGFDAIGIDANKGDVTMAKKHLGIDLVLGFYDDKSFPEKSFEAISVEGLAYYFRPSIADFLKIVRHHLVDDGIVYFQVPEAENIGPSYMPNFIRCLIPFENAESIFARMGWNVISKNRKYFQVGSFGVILQPKKQIPNQSAPLPFERVWRNLVMSDYNFLSDRTIKKPRILTGFLLFLHGIAPGGTGAVYFSKIANRIYRRAR